jgi:hypothetical protein
LSGNSAVGAAALGTTGTTTVRASTITGNTTSSGTGAILGLGTANFIEDTITDNTGGGLVQDAGSVAGTIVAGNPGGNCAGTITDGGYNSTDTTTGATACPFHANVVVGDPRLNDLADNGGPTQTQLPKETSPVLNQVPPGTSVLSGAFTLCSSESTDQRGVSRPQGPKCDIGSVETSKGAPTLTGPSSLRLVVGHHDSVTFTVTGAPTPTVSASTTLPSGVTLTDNGDGTVTLGGTPASGTAGTYTFTIKASNGVSPDATIPFTLRIVDPLAITTTSLPGGNSGSAYSANLVASGGVTPYTWSITGSLPGGLHLDSATGAITGTINDAPGTYTFTVQVSDADDPQQVATKSLSIAVQVPTTLVAYPAVLQLSPLRISITNLSATLTTTAGNTPIAGQTIRFVSGSTTLCTATTDANGFAKCPSVPLGATLNVLLSLGYTAVFDGTAAGLQPSSAKGSLIG